MDWFAVKGERIIFTGTLMKAFIPQAYFDMGLAHDYGGDHIETFGLFNAKFYSDKDGNKQVGNMETVNLPTLINIYPSSIEVTDIELIKEVGVEKYQVMSFYGGEPFTDKFIIKNSNNARSFVDMLEGGKIPPTVPYDKLLDIWNMNMGMNGVNMPDVPSASREMIIAEKYRDKKNPAFRFGIKAGKDPKASMYDYKAASPRMLTKYSSTFAGFTFEDIDTMITNGLNISKTGRKQVESPIEPIIKY